MAKMTGLGKGLDALFSSTPAVEEEEENKSGEIVKNIKLIEIEPNKEQARKIFDEESIDELANSIKEYGVIQPIIVTKKGNYYEIVAGERRWRASKRAGLTEIPAIIRDDDERRNKEISLIENIQREDLNPIDEAFAYQKIIELSKMTQEEFAKKFGKSRSYVTNMLGLLNLPENVKELVKKHEISMGHARALSKISDDAKVSELASRIVSEDLSVRDLEKTIQEGSLPKYREQDRMKETKSIRNTIYEKIMREKVGTKVKIKTKKIEIPYDSEKDLERILEILGIRIEGV